MASENRYDVVVIGGGIHGVGVAQAAAAGGYSVLLLEKTQLATGTSSRSSKLIHGGLRYLESFEFSLVRESLRERELLLRLAPTLVHRQPFFIPVYPQTSRRPLLLRCGLTLYTILSGLRKSTWYRKVPRREWNQLDGLTTHRLQHVYQYWDAQADDAALTRAVMKSAQSMGAELLCPAEFLAAEICGDGCGIRFRTGSQENSVTSRVLVNAAGPWASRIVERISPRPPSVETDNVQGTHLELPARIEHGCYYVEAIQDGRAVFVMPWKGRTLLGTTELEYTGDPGKCEPTRAEIEYLLNVYEHYFPDRPREVLNAWAGLRVLPSVSGAAFKRSRETQLPVDDPVRPRFLSIFGGKLTAYRSTAEKVMRRLRPTLPKRKRVTKTAELELVE